MLQRLLVWLAWAYWYANRPFVAAFAETLLGYGEGDLKVNGRHITRKITRYMRRIQPQVLLQFMATLALLPLYSPRSFPKSAVRRALAKLWYGIKSFFAHGHFLMSTKPKRARWVDTMFRNLIECAPDQEEDIVKTIVTLTLFKSVLGIAYLEQPEVWRALGHHPYQQRSCTPPSGPDLANPPETEAAKVLHAMRKTPREVARKPTGRQTYCVIGSGAGGAVAARTLQERFPG